MLKCFGAECVAEAATHASKARSSPKNQEQNAIRAMVGMLE
jgi:hypothetical protein